MHLCFVVLQYPLDLDQLLRRGRELLNCGDLTVHIFHKPVHHQDLVRRKDLTLCNTELTCLIIDRAVKGAEAAVRESTEALRAVSDSWKSILF